MPAPIPEKRPAGTIFLTLSLAVLVITVAGCSKESWYYGAKAAQEADCMQQPLPEYNDCTRQTGQSYEQYENERKALKVEAEKQ